METWWMEPVGDALVVVPAADDELAEHAEEEEDGDAEQHGHDQRPVELWESRLLTEQLGDDADARLLARAEELLADDGADDAEAGGDAEADEDRRQCGGELQLA